MDPGALALLLKDQLQVAALSLGENPPAVIKSTEVETVAYDPESRKVLLNSEWIKSIPERFDNNRDCVQAFLLGSLGGAVADYVKALYPNPVEEIDGQAEKDRQVGDMMALSEVPLDIFERVLDILAEPDPDGFRAAKIREGFDWRSRNIQKGRNKEK